MLVCIDECQFFSKLCVESIAGDSPDHTAPTGTAAEYLAGLRGWKNKYHYKAKTNCQ